MDFSRPDSKEIRVLMPENIEYVMHFEAFCQDYGDGLRLTLGLSGEVGNMVYQTSCLAKGYYKGGKPVPEMFDIFVRVFEEDMRKAIGTVL